jgi:uncharacterized protein YdhG (YjbR/CyaY superfamily)
MKRDFKSVDDYIDAQPDHVRSVLNRVRSIIRKALPKAEEVMSYQIPAYKVKGERVIYFAGWKQHYSLYPAGARLVAAFKEELAPYEVSKGTIRFLLSEPVPVNLITQIAKFRARDGSVCGAATEARARELMSRTSNTLRIERGKGNEVHSDDEWHEGELRVICGMVEAGH